MITFVVGGARSGKSGFTLKTASLISGRKAYIATAQPFDEEMKERILKHQIERGNDWDTIEEPIKLAETLRLACRTYQVIIIDCLTLWLSNILCDNMNVTDEIENLINSLQIMHHTQHLFIVSNEVGFGIVPENELARRFRDMAGILNQKIAEIADEVFMSIAGIPVKIK